MKIISVINNNNVCVKNDKGKEQIVFGKGIGFARKPGDTVLPSQIQKTYLITDSAMQKKLIELLSEIPEGYIKFSDDLVTHIKETLPGELSESLLVTLSDHISFAVKRKRKGIELTNPMLDSLRTCYPEELELGFYCLEQIRQRLKVSFMPDEAGFIAMHIINARLGTEMSDVYDTTKLTHGCSEIALHRFPAIRMNSVSYDRFMVHMRFLARRIAENQMLPPVLTADSSLPQQLQTEFPAEFSCAGEIVQYVQEIRKVILPTDEMITLTIHLAKMNAEAEPQ